MDASVLLSTALDAVHSKAGQVACAVLGLVLGSFLLTWLQATVSNFLRIRRGLANVPSAPGGNWLLGHVIPLSSPSKPPWEVVNDWVRDRSIVQYRIFNVHGVTVGDPESMKRVFQTRQRVYDKELNWTYYHFLDILGSGLVTANGRLWQNQRLLIGPALRGAMLDEVVVMARHAVDRLSKKLQSVKGSGRPVNMDDEFRLLTLQVIGEAVLSLPPEECDKVFPSLYLPVMEEANTRVFQPWRAWLPTPSWFAYKSRVSRLNSYIIDVIKRRWRARTVGNLPEAPDLLDRILAAIEERGEKLNSQMEQQLCYELKTFLLAGHETSAAMLSWTLYELTQHPDSLAKVKEEALDAFGQGEEQQADRDAVERMQFTLSSLKESLRKYSVVPVVMRITNQDDELAGKRVPAGTLVMCVLQAVHEQWKSPHAWQPQRFLPGGEYERFDEGIRPFMFLPFIQGPRNCLGQFFALLEARVVLSLLVKRFKFRPISRDVRRHPKVIPVGPEGGMHMLVD